MTVLTLLFVFAAVFNTLFTERILAMPKSRQLPRWFNWGAFRDVPTLVVAIKVFAVFLVFVAWKFMNLNEGFIIGAFVFYLIDTIRTAFLWYRTVR